MTFMTSTGRILTAMAAAAVIWALSGTIDRADAQALQCGNRQAVVTALTDKFKETRQGMGLVSSRRVIELYVSRTGSWTILFTNPDGVSCIGGAGQHWQTTAPTNDGPWFSG